MPRNQAFDSREIKQMLLPYAPNQGYLCEKELITSGHDTFVTFGGNLRKRLGSLTFGTTVPTTSVPYKTWIYETLEATPVVYIVQSVKNGSVYQLQYQKLSTADTWHTVTERRGCNHSTTPHEGLVRRGFMYIKGTPLVADDPTLLGSIRLDGTGGTMVTHDWGALAPTVPVTLAPPTNNNIISATNANPVVITVASPHLLTTGETVVILGFTGSWTPANGAFIATITGPTTFTIPVNSTGFGAVTGAPILAGWAVTPSAHPVTVQNSWIYVYTYVLASGQETDHSPLQTNPDLRPSSTGPFANACPFMSVMGIADTTEYPFINIYRTTDGGGTFFFLHQTPNPGAISTIFEDKFLASAAGNQDPLPDIYLDTSHQAPYLQSNAPPPTVTPPQVTGTDAIERCSRIVEYAARIWYGINEFLYFSANEELTTGVPEESFPSGTAAPNFFRMPETITNLVRTPQGLLVITRKQVIRITGTSLSTFNPLPFLGGEGGAYQQSRAATEVGENGAWLTQDYRIAVVHGTNYAIITNPIGDALKTAVVNGALIELEFWNQGDKKYLFCAAHRPDAPASSQWFVYDLDRAVSSGDDFWFTPWNIKSTAITVGQASVADTENKLFVSLYNGTNVQLAYLDATGVTASDPDPTTLAPVPYGWSFRTSLLSVPIGDHVNQLREPDFSPAVASLSIEKTNYTGDAVPIVNAYLDNTSTTPNKVLTIGDPPARRAQSQNYSSLYFSEVMSVAKHVAMELVGNVDTVQAEIAQIGFEWLPESGS